MNINDLPNEVLGQIFCFLPEGRPAFNIDTLNLCRVRLVCKRWRDNCDNPSTENPYFDVYSRQFSIHIPQYIENAHTFYVNAYNDLARIKGKSVNKLVYAIYRNWEKQFNFLLYRQNFTKAKTGERVPIFTEINKSVLCISNVEILVKNTTTRCLLEKSINGLTPPYQPDELDPDLYNYEYTPLQMAARVGNLVFFNELLKVPGINKNKSNICENLINYIVIRILFINQDLMAIAKSLLQQEGVIVEDDILLYQINESGPLPDLNKAALLIPLFKRADPHFDTVSYLHQIIMQADNLNHSELLIPFIETENPSQENDMGEGTLLHLLFEIGCSHLALIALKHSRAEPFKLDSYGKDALDYALEAWKEGFFSNQDLIQVIDILFKKLRPIDFNKFLDKFFALPQNERSTQIRMYFLNLEREKIEDDRSSKRYKPEKRS